MKCCTRCELWKSDAEFYPDRRPGRSRDGRLSTCIDCERAAARDRARRRYVPLNTMRQPRDAAGRFARAS